MMLAWTIVKVALQLNWTWLNKIAELEQLMLNRQKIVCVHFWTQFALIDFIVYCMHCLLLAFRLLTLEHVLDICQSIYIEICGLDGQGSDIPYLYCLKL